MSFSFASSIDETGKLPVGVKATKSFQNHTDNYCKTSGDVASILTWILLMSKVVRVVWRCRCSQMEYVLGWTESQGTKELRAIHILIAVEFSEGTRKNCSEQQKAILDDQRIKRAITQRSTVTWRNLISQNKMMQTFRCDMFSSWKWSSSASHISFPVSILNIKSLCMFCRNIFFSFLLHDKCILIVVAFCFSS